MAWIDVAVAKIGTMVNSGMFTYCLWSCLAGILTIYFYHKTKKWRIINKIPGLKTVPFFGNALLLNVSPKEIFKVATEIFCNPKHAISRVWLGWIPFCILYKAKTVEIIMSSSKNIEKGSEYIYLHPWLGTGLLTASGKKWHSRRKMLTPAFHFKILEDFVEVFNEQSSVLVKKLSGKADTGKSFDIFQDITLCTLDIILESAMGRSINAQGNSDSDYVKSVYKLTEIVQKRQTRLWYHVDFIFNFTKMKTDHDNAIKILHDFSNKVIKEKRKMLENTKPTEIPEEDIILGKKKKLAFMDLLLDYSDNNNVLSNEDVREEVDTFMFEGHDTTAAAVNWTVYLLGSHPEIQDKAYKEIHSIMGDSDRSITSADVKEMKYLELCSKEALRLFPSVPWIGRTLSEDVVIDGYKIPSGTQIVIVVYTLHRDPSEFPDPEKFIPERFLPEYCTERNPYAYIPFSAGPRNCIGQKFAQLEDKIILANLLRNYRIESIVDRKDLQILGEIILRPEGGNMVKLFKRKL